MVVIGLNHYTSLTDIPIHGIMSVIGPLSEGSRSQPFKEVNFHYALDHEITSLGHSSMRFS